MKNNLRSKLGFTILELLTVIGIISVLAAILFPITASVQAKAKQGQCMSNMREIAHAIQQYKLDEEIYPEHLLVYHKDEQNPNVGRFDGIYPYLSMLNRYHCPNNPVSLPTGTTVPADAVEMANQPKAEVSFLQPDGTTVTETMYFFNSYDGAVEGATEAGPDTILGGTYVPHYNRTRIANPSSGQAFPPDYDKQLRFRRPLGTTVVTWCSYHRNGPGYLAGKGSTEVFLWLDGHARVVTYEDVVKYLNELNPPVNDPADYKDNWWRYSPTK